jgi:hypothetical protein
MGGFDAVRIGGAAACGVEGRRAIADMLLAT